MGIRARGTSHLSLDRQGDTLVRLYCGIRDRGSRRAPLAYPRACGAGAGLRGGRRGECGVRHSMSHTTVMSLTQAGTSRTRYRHHQRDDEERRLRYYPCDVLAGLSSHPRRRVVSTAEARIMNRFAVGCVVPRCRQEVGQAAPGTQRWYRERLARRHHRRTLIDFGRPPNDD